MKPLRGAVPVLLAVLAGVLLALALPPRNWEWLGWIALVPLLAAALERRPLEAMGLGMLSGVTAGLVHGYLDVPFFLLAMFLGTVATVSSLGLRRWSGLPWVLLVACAGVSVEWVTTFLPIPIHLALCQYLATPIIQIAAFTGVWGVSFLLWWVNAALADALLRRQPRSPALAAGVLGLLLALGFGYGQLQAAQGKPAERLRVAAIQDYQYSDVVAFLPMPADNGEEADREAMTRRAAEQGARLVVWSEMSLGGGFTPEHPRDPTIALARETGAHLVPGYTEEARPKRFNCAAFVSPEGEVKGVHRKIHLFLGERRGTQSGREARAFDTELGRLGMEICFDSCYTGVTRRIVADGARLIAMPNYDPPVPGGVLHYLHAAVLPFRAVENRVPFVRADATGCSQVIDSTGRVLREAPLYAADTLVADVTLGNGRGTLFTRLGDWLAYLCLLLTAGYAVAAAGKRPLSPHD